MSKTRWGRPFDRRQVLAGAVSAGASLAIHDDRVLGQTAVPTPVPVRLQTPDLAFADGLGAVLEAYGSGNGDSELILSIVPAEPASDQLLNDARSGARRFSGALVPYWLIPDLVRDDFILPVAPPPEPLPAAVAQLRSFGGAWVATDLDHDCDLLFYRQDLLSDPGYRESYAAKSGSLLEPPSSWDELERQAVYFAGKIGGGVALPQTHSQQVVDHFASMAACFVIDGSIQADFWFDRETMDPSIESPAHQEALDTWRRLARTTPDSTRTGSTGDLWDAFLTGAVAFLIAQADFLPFALERSVDPSVIGVTTLPGHLLEAGELNLVGNVTGASWGGVVMRASSAGSEVAGFLDYLATADVQRGLWSDPFTGVTPSVPAGSSAEIVQSLDGAGWPQILVTNWIQAIQSTLTNPVQLPALRIAETRRYLQALEGRIETFLASDSVTASEALAQVATDWRQINDAIGVDVQRDLHARSLAPPPTVALPSNAS